MGWKNRDTKFTPNKLTLGPQGYSSGPYIEGLDEPPPTEDFPLTVASTSLTDINGEVIRELPVCDTTDPADLEAWFGNFAYADHFRKVVLASAREIERAKATERSEKVTEARLDDLSRVSDVYVGFLIQNLHGRRLRERNVLDSNRTG